MNNLLSSDILAVMEVVSMSMPKNIIWWLASQLFTLDWGIDTAADMEHGVHVLLAFR